LPRDDVSGIVRFYFEDGGLRENVNEVYNKAKVIILKAAQIHQSPVGIIIAQIPARGLI
jgi:hypothetical protein